MSHKWYRPRLVVLLAGVLIAGLAIGGWTIRGCRSVPAELPRTIATTERIAVLTESWDADGDVNWQVAALLGEMSKDVYGWPDEAEVAEAAFRALGFTEVTLILDGSTVAAVASRDRVAVVVFRGTVDLENWLTNLTVRAAKIPGGHVHRGFLLAYRGVQDRIRAAVKEIDAEHVWITGHSLGGALAVVCAHDFRQDDAIGVTGIVTFGQPMVGKPNLSGHLDSLLAAKHQRFVNGWDIVARVPPSYRHSGSYVWFDGGEVRRPRAQFQLFATDNAEAAPAAEQPPAPLSDDEFRQLQVRLRQSEDEPDLETRQFRAYGNNLPWVRDHLMERYLTRIAESRDSSE